MAIRECVAAAEVLKPGIKIGDLWVYEWSDGAVVFLTVMHKKPRTTHTYWCHEVDPGIGHVGQDYWDFSVDDAYDADGAWTLLSRAADE